MIVAVSMIRTPSSGYSISTVRPEHFSPSEIGSGLTVLTVGTNCSLCHKERKKRRGQKR